jgi:hypothetical protein
VEVIHEYFVQLFWSQKTEEVVLRVSFVVPLKRQTTGVFVINDCEAVITGGFHGSSRLREFKPATNCGLTNAKLSGNGFVGQTALMQASAFLYLLLPVLMLKLLNIRDRHIREQRVNRIFLWFDNKIRAQAWDLNAGTLNPLRDNTQDPNGPGTRISSECFVLGQNSILSFDG